MKTIANGAYPTMLTPYTEKNEVDSDCVERLIEFYTDRKCHGVFALCQSSEIFFLTLSEKISILRTVNAYLKRNPDRKLEVVASSHTSDSLEAQAEELTAMYENGASASVIISNRLDLKNEGNAVWLKNAEKLLAMLPSDMQLGIYECPYPYKKLLDDEIMSWCKATKRFSFIKDTCCDPAMLAHRLEYLKGSTLKLYNANTQTLLLTQQLGAAGYSGIMGNFHPEYYVWLCENYAKEPEKARLVQSLLTYWAFIETQMYPVCAKYRMQLMGIKMTLKTRSVDGSAFGEYQKDIVKQGMEAEKFINEKLGFDFNK